MAVTNNATLIEDHEGAGPTYTSVGGGQGAGTETNFYFRGIQASSRKMDLVTKNGFWFNPGVTFDLSAAGTHVKFFINAITQAGFTDFWVRLGPSTTIYEEHAVGVGFYDNDAGGWIPVWVEVDAGVDTGSPTFTAVDEFCVLCTMGDISGNVKNWVTDQTHHATRPVFLWDGTGGDLDDFITTETTAGVGCLKRLNGLYTCFANFKVGSATATTFNAAGKTVAFPDATWLPAASAWMGIDFDLQNASTDLDWTSGSVISGNPAGATARKPDIIVTGTAGALDFTGRVFDGLRIMTLTSAVTADSCLIANSGLITAGGASFIGASVLSSAVAADEGALYDNRTISIATTLSEYDGMTFTKGPNAHHAMRFGANVTGDLTLRNIEFTNFGSTADANDSTIRFDATSGALTLNLQGCTVGGVAASALNFSIDDAAGITVTPVFDTIPLKVTVTDSQTGNPLPDARVYLHEDGNTSNVYFNDECDVNGEVNDSIAYPGDTAVVGWAREMSLSGTDYTPKNIAGTITSAGLDILVELDPL